MQRTRLDLRGSIDQLVFLLRPVARYAGISSTEQQLVELGTEQASESALLAALAPLAEKIRYEPAVLLDLVRRNPDVGSLRKALGLDLGAFNDALRALGRPYSPISYRQEHEHAFRSRTDQLRPKILDALRARFLDDFASIRPLQPYVAARSLATIEPDPLWYERYDDLPDTQITERANAWLVTFGADGLTTPAPALPPLDEVREQNRAMLRSFADQYGLLVSAWVRKELGASSLPDPWAAATTLKQRLVELGSEGGWIDFKFLDDVSVVAWLAASDHWPRGMPVSTDMAVLGLTQGDLVHVDEAIKQQKDEQQRRRTSITFAGKEVSALEDGYQDLVTTVMEQVGDADQLLNSPDQYADLEELETRDSRPGGGGGSGGGGGRTPKNPDTQLSDEQRQAIGLIGELLAREWLRKVYRDRYQIEVTDECWVSRNRNKALATTGGRDDLGYDFEIRLKATTHYYEVKASTGDPGSFELGPTEIAAAQRFKRDEKQRYRILYLPNVLNSLLTRALMLPNPFSKGGERVLKMVGGSGVRYRFSEKIDDET